MVKQSAVEKEKEGKTQLPHEEPISAETLLRSHILNEQIIDLLRKRNSESGIMVDVTDFWGRSDAISGPAKKRVKLSDTNAFVDYEDPRPKRNKLRWLSQVQNQRTGGFYTLDNLIQNNVIAESERDLFEFPSGISDFPYRQIYQFHRIRRSDGSEYFSTHEQWTGISKTATVITISVSDLYWYIKPAVKFKLRDMGTSIT